MRFHYFAESFKKHSVEFLAYPISLIFRVLIQHVKASAYPDKMGCICLPDKTGIIYSMLARQNGKHILVRQNRQHLITKQNRKHMLARQNGNHMLARQNGEHMLAIQNGKHTLVRK